MVWKTHRFLALGDSYTIGAMVDVKKRWPDQLAQQLTSAGVKIAKPTIIAKTGWTSTDLLGALSEATLEGPFDLVTLQIGVNNQFQNLDTEDYRAEFKELLQKAICYSTCGPTSVIVLSIPDWSTTPFAADRDRDRIRHEIELFNHLNHRETSHEGAHYVDITAISRQLQEQPAWITRDGLHPSGKLYAQWVKLIFPTAYQILAKKLG